MQVKDRSRNLNCVTKELIDSGRHLQDITDKKVDCLRAFVHHKKFADWLKKSLKGMMLSYLLFLVYFLFINNKVIVNTQQFMTVYKVPKFISPMVTLLLQHIAAISFMCCCGF